MSTEKNQTDTKNAFFSFFAGNRHIYFFVLIIIASIPLPLHRKSGLKKGQGADLTQNLLHFFHLFPPASV